MLFTLQKNKDATKITIITLEETKWGENKDRLYKTKKIYIIKEELNSRQKRRFPIDKHSNY